MVAFYVSFIELHLQVKYVEDFLKCMCWALTLTVADVSYFHDALDEVGTPLFIFA